MSGLLFDLPEAQAPADPITDRMRAVGRAVREMREKGTVDTDSELEAEWRARDFYPTPPWAIRAMAELVLKLDPEARRVCEPAAGEGHGVFALDGYFDHVFASDVKADFPRVVEQDWLSPTWCADGPIDWFITNPPFVLASEFVRLGLERARGVALLCRLAFIETAGRYELFTGAHPLTQLGVFTDRVSMELGTWDPYSSTATAYAVFMWIRGAPPQAPTWIAPGTRARLTHPHDAALYGWT